MPARLPGIILYESHTLALAFGLPAVAAATLEGGADGRRSSLVVQEGSGDREGGMPQASELSSQRYLLSEHPVSRAHKAETQK